MHEIRRYLFTHTWWSCNSASPWYEEPYHWMNLIEGCAWLVFAALVLARYLPHRNSPLELLYSLAFVTFGLSDFREAYALESWLILFKGINLVALFVLRWQVIRNWYPESRTF